MRAMHRLLLLGKVFFLYVIHIIGIVLDRLRYLSIAWYKRLTYGFPIAKHFIFPLREIWNKI